MSWLAASLIVLGLALVAGFAWYERSHPSARVLALVATLAALAALGRIAFAPLPNVKPTTDIVLLTGYALGGAPGFAVGAVAALASNVFFGQGPWTPWQMCAWGGVGVAGALLARAFGRELGRASLAVACAAAGAGYGVVMNLHLWVTYSGDHSLAKLWAYFVTSLPFDLAHVIGNVLFCLVFGPALVRALTRYRQRFEVTWRPAPALVASLLAALVLVAAAPRAAEAATPLQWLQSTQNRDGGFGGDKGQRSTGLYTSWAGPGARGRRAQPARRQPRRRATSSPTSAPTHRRGAPTSATPPARSCCSAPPACPRGSAAATSWRSCWRRRRGNGSFANRVNTTAFAIFALRADRRPRRHRQARRPLDRARGQPRRRLQLRGEGGGLRDRRHRRRAAGARRRGPARDADRPPRGPLPRPPPEPGRRLPAAAGRALQRAVDGVGGPGARRRRPQPGPPAPQRREVPDRLPALAHRPERPGPVLAHQPPDPRVGDRPGGRGARPQAVPARPGAAGAEGGPRTDPDPDRDARHRSP